MVTAAWSAPRDTLSKAFGDYLEEARRGRPVLMSMGEGRDGPLRYGRKHAHTSGTDLAPFYKMQQVLRPMYGKDGIHPPAIGDHPDFKHLKGTDDKIYCPIATMFMDIEGSTRLGLLYPLEDVFRIKNAFIRAAIEVIASFDGHVHRIMGDAVMAYFGGPGVRPEAAAIDGLNCAAILRALAERVVVPRLAQMGYDHEFGIRVGLDFGAKDSVLWSSYGYTDSDEVTATSFYVDVASKLQHAAGRNQIMIGDSLKTFLDMPDDFLAVKKVIQRGAEVEDAFVRPNHTNLAGEPINYRQHVFKGDSYLELGPLGQLDRKLIGASDKSGALLMPVTAEICARERGEVEHPYALCSSPVPKSKWLRFTVNVLGMPRLPYTIRCSVENHGEEAFRLAGPQRGNHEKIHSIRTQREHTQFEHWETTAYRGLHYVTIEVRGHAGRFQRTIGVFVE